MVAKQSRLHLIGPGPIENPGKHPIANPGSRVFDPQEGAPRCRADREDVSTFKDVYLEPGPGFGPGLLDRPEFLRGPSQDLLWDIPFDP